MFRRACTIAVVLLPLLLLVKQATVGAQQGDAPQGNPQPEQQPASAEHVGSQACLACHEDAAAALVHVGADREDPECETCHGPGSAHVDSGGDSAMIRRLAALPARESAAVCRTCHVGDKTLHWDGSTHEQRDIGCTDCHAVHDAGGKKHALLPKGSVEETCYRCHQLQRVQMMRSSHMPVREGKMTCTDCHNPHGTLTDGLLVDRSINDNCYRCHAEKRGPVLFEHPPVRENCLNCHQPHGSLHEAMLISKPPRLCQNCHINSRHPSDPRNPASRYVFNRSCANCHSQIHGSNHPSGIRMMR